MGSSSSRLGSRHHRTPTMPKHNRRLLSALVCDCASSSHLSTLQDDVFDKMMNPIVEDIMKGKSGMLAAFGPSGSENAPKMFLHPWLKKHPSFELFSGNELGNEPIINIKGYILNNPLTYRSIDFNSRIPYAHQFALLSNELFKAAEINCHGDYKNENPSTLCVDSLQEIDKENGYSYFGLWANEKSLREALHIHKIKREVATMKSIKHPHVVRLFQVYFPYPQPIP
ncbi:serine carboxypeptidase-like 12 [Apium graveolens]|uniref:serine carboxypeptidase-like 12 n=1 Tax=Apium graveolens TaxID=4045 RepID=UPI003D7AFB4E